MTQFSSREPFNDDPDTVIPTNPTNPILTEFRRLVDTTGNGLYVTAWLLAGDLIEEWASYPEDQWDHAMDVLEKILRIYREDKK